MKDAEDEAFDELAKRQGMWGGGFMAKKAMAADKQREWVGLTDEDIKEIIGPYGDTPSRATPANCLTKLKLS